MNSAPGGFSTKNTETLFVFLTTGGVRANRLVPPGNVDALMAALDRLMGDAALRVPFATRAVEARERVSVQKIPEVWEKLFGRGT